MSPCGSVSTHEQPLRFWNPTRPGKPSGDMNTSNRDDVANKMERSTLGRPRRDLSIISPYKSSHPNSPVIGSKIHKSTSSKTKPFKAPKPPSSKPPSQKHPPAPPPSLMHVYVNSRLGGRFNILCSPTDSIGDFKKMVAVYAGTRAVAILLKRQGMRPFLDRLTLEEYEIGDGSSLDMEVDTGE